MLPNSAKSRARRHGLMAAVLGLTGFMGLGATVAALVGVLGAVMGFCRICRLWRRLLAQKPPGAAQP
jgi:hypothetical protein